MITDYSKKEFQMIEALSPSFASLIRRDIEGPLSAPKILELIALECFINKLQGTAVDSLRRCMKALRECHPFRGTPEYDSLIQL